MQKKKKKSLNDKIEDIVSNNTIWVFLGFILVVIILPRFLLEKSFLGYVPNDPKIDPSSIINNLTTPIIGLFSAFLVYIAFREQVKANKELEKFNNRDTKIKELANIFSLSDRLISKVNKLELILDNTNPSDKIIGISSISNSLYKIHKNQILFKNTNLSDHFNNCSDLYDYLSLLIKEINNSKLEDNYKSYFLNQVKEYYNFIDVAELINNNVTENGLSNITFESKIDELLYELSYNKLIDKIKNFQSSLSN